MELAIRVQFLDKAVCHSLCANALEKGINPYLLSIYRLIVQQTKAHNVGEGKTEFKPTVLCLKIKLTVTSCSWWRSWVNTYMCIPGKI